MSTDAKLPKLVWGWRPLGGKWQWLQEPPMVPFDEQVFRPFRPCPIGEDGKTDTYRALEIACETVKLHKRRIAELEAERERLRTWIREVSASDYISLAADDGVWVEPENGEPAETSDGLVTNKAYIWSHQAEMLLNPEKYSDQALAGGEVGK